MKILIISYFFPPFNAVGALRAGKMAKYLSLMGHDIRVLTANNQMLPQNLPVEIEKERVIRTKWINVNAIIAFLLGGKEKISTKGYEEAKSLPGFVKKLGYFYRNYFNFPDAQIGWYPFAIREGKKLLDSWKPDVIWSTSPPPTVLLVAKKLSSLYKIPWTADFRDLWADNHNAEYYYSTLRRLFDKKLERHVLKSARAFITISSPLANKLKQNFLQPVHVISNGYDQADYPMTNRDFNDPKLHIVYTGTVHSKKENFASLFEAIAQLGDDAKNLRVDFYGKGNGLMQKFITFYNLHDYVFLHAPTTYHESLQLQVNADILLLLIHNSPKENGSLPAKFIEYIGAKKPILLIGCVDGLAGNIIKKRKLGLAENDVAIIAQFLRSFIVSKTNGESFSFSDENIADFSRSKKATELIDILGKL